ncbi:MAG TPA: GNAT family N-acetyltransferase [Candidatus Baltobacteraceae bacterium]|jgi:GNAT superfamily N-acetyltransferase|nr:GNAT family N-acetyltransferase [Candidatus Baltobacteraceae bacterium]
MHDSARSVELRVPAHALFSPLVRTVVADCATRAQLESQRVEAVSTASGMALELIVRDAIPDASSAIRVRTDWTASEFSVSIFEFGLPLDESAAMHDPAWRDIVGNVDRAHWKIHGRSGTELRLRLTRSLTGDNGAPVERYMEERAPEQTYTVRRFRPHDALGVARAFYRTWGYRYILPAVYVPERLIEMNAHNAYISMIALDENEEVVGHYALEPVAESPIADACGAVVVPAHRGRGLLERLRQAAEDEAIRLGLRAYYSEPVTMHDQTQRESAKFGACICAIVLGGDPAWFVPKQMRASGTNQRQSFTVYFKALAPRERRLIYPPVAHSEMIERIYANLGLPVEIGEPLTAPAHVAAGMLHVEMVPCEGYAKIDVAQAGPETAEHLSQAIQDVAAHRNIGAIYVDLPLEQSGSQPLCDYLERSGFFFAGVIPYAMAGSDVLRMQRPLTAIDLDQVTIIGEFGTELKRYIGVQMAAIHGKSVR